MKRGDLILLGVALFVAIIFIGTGAARLPVGRAAYVHAPVLVYAEPLLDPLVVTAKKVVSDRSIENACDRGDSRSSPVRESRAR